VCLWSPNGRREIDEIVLYPRQEGRGIGLMEKLKAYNLQDEGLDTVDANLAHGHQADARSYEVAAGMLPHEVAAGIIQGPLTDGKEVIRMMDTIFLASNPSALTVAGESGDDPASKYAPPSAKMRDETTESGKQPATATLINYTKDRTAFVNEVAVLPRYASSTASFDVTTPPFLSPSPCRTSPTAETLGVFIGGMGQGAEDKGEEWGVFTKTPNRSFSSVFVDDFGRSSCPFAKPDRAHDSHQSQ